MTRARVLAAALLLSCPLLAGCGSPAPSATTPAPPSPTGSASSTTTPTPTATVTPSEPAPQPSTEPDPQPTDPATAAPPADWSDDELLGACKEAWVASGEPIDWSRYSPEAIIEARGSEWYVAIPSSDGSKSLECMVGGTPTNASVRTLR